MWYYLGKIKIYAVSIFLSNKMDDIQTFLQSSSIHGLHFISETNVFKIVISHPYIYKKIYYFLKYLYLYSFFQSVRIPDGKTMCRHRVCLIEQCIWQPARQILYNLLAIQFQNRDRLWNSAVYCLLLALPRWHLGARQKIWLLFACICNPRPEASIDSFF